MQSNIAKGTFKKSPNFENIHKSTPFVHPKPVCTTYSPPPPDIIMAKKNALRLEIVKQLILSPSRNIIWVTRRTNQELTFKDMTIVCNICQFLQQS
ncbi:8793_t:CDS:2, partial [Acaulospora morrowiae]